VVTARTIDHFEDAKQRRLIEARAETAIEVLEVRRDVARSVAAEIAERVAAGLVPAAEQAQAEAQAELVALELERAKCDLAEVHASKRSPDDDLDAPVHDGRDFVAARLELELRRQEVLVRQMEVELARAKQLVEAEMMRAAEIASRAAELERLAAARRDTERRLEIRRRVVAGEMSGAEAGSRAELQAARTRLERADTIVGIVEAQLEEVVAARERGTVTESDLQQAKLQLAEARAEQRLARLEHELLVRALAQ
jgi:hypothetical protein